MSTSISETDRPVREPKPRRSIHAYKEKDLSQQRSSSEESGDKVDMGKNPKGNPQNNNENNELYPNLKKKLDAEYGENEGHGAHQSDISSSEESVDELDTRKNPKTRQLNEKKNLLKNKNLSPNQEDGKHKGHGVNKNDLKRKNANKPNAFKKWLNKNIKPWFTKLRKIFEPFLNYFFKREDFTPESYRPPKPYEKYLPVFAVTVIMLGVIIINSPISLRVFNSLPVNSCKGTVNVSERIISMRNKYSGQDSDFWEMLHFGIEDVDRNEEPVTFMLTYWKDDESDKDDANDIAKDAANIAAQFYNGDSCARMTEVKLPVNMGDNDHGYLVSEYKEPLLKSRALVVPQLQRWPGTIAQGLRYLTDEFAPIGKESKQTKYAIFILFNMAECGNINKEDFINGSERTTIVQTEGCLRNLWMEEIGFDILTPVISRITELVLKVLPDNHEALS